MTKDTKAYGLARVSTEKQGDNGHSLDAQKAKIEAFCKDRGCTLMGIFADTSSAFSKPLAKRPEASKLLPQLQAGDVVVATKLDRVFRNTVEALTVIEAWTKKGVHMVLLDLGGMVVDSRTPAGKMFLTMLAAIGEMERGMISERTKAIVGHLKASGKVYGPIPFGFDRDGHDLVESPDEQVVIARMKAMRAEGMSLKRIADRLNEEGVPTKHGGTWHQFTISKVLGK